MPPMASDPTSEPGADTAAPAVVVASAPAAEETETVGLVQPYHARKRYVCPGCQGTIEKGEGHLVVVPEHTPDLRRHWHRACWHRERRRRNGRSG
jgi:hypothetical protein